MEKVNNKMKLKEFFQKKIEGLLNGFKTILTKKSVVIFLFATFSLYYVLFIITNEHWEYLYYGDFIILVLPLLLLLWTVYHYLNIIFPSPKKSKLESAYELLLKGYSQKTLNGKSINLIYSREIVSNNGMTSMSKLVFLESFLIYVRKNDYNKDGALTKGITEIIDPILEEERKGKPYPNVNDTERRILIEIEDSVEKGETASIKSRIEDLSTIIVKNQNALNRANKINNLTIPVSIFSVVLTLFIWLYGMFATSLSDKDVERISREVSSFVKDSINTKNNIENTTTVDTLSVKQ